MEVEHIERTGRFHFVSKLIFSAISGALTACFAIAGAITGAIAGALASRASESGFVRGTTLGAIAGAIISVEVLEASRAYWCLEQSGSRSSSSMVGTWYNFCSGVSVLPGLLKLFLPLMSDYMYFIEQLVRGRFVEEQFTPSIRTSYSWQVGSANPSHDEILEVHGLISPRGLPGDTLKKLPHYVILKDTKLENLCCTICLQDIEVGEVARSLPRCHHAFHLNCVDTWLLNNDSCPVCRQYV